MAWAFLILVATVIGLVVGLMVANRTFENEPQQIILVRNTSIVAAALCAAYFALRKRPPAT